MFISVFVSKLWLYKELGFKRALTVKSKFEQRIQMNSVHIIHIAMILK